MSRRERRGADSWRKTQAAARVDWCRHVFATEGWLYAVQTLRNGITANTFQASTVLTLGGLSVGRLKQASHVQVASVVCCLVASAYTFSQSARLMLHAGFWFPVAAGDPQQRAAVEKIMVRSHRLQWMGWRWLYHAAWPVAWLAGGPAASLGASLALTLFFAREDRAPVASSDWCTVYAGQSVMWTVACRPSSIRTILRLLSRVAERVGSANARAPWRPRNRR